MRRSLLNPFVPAAVALALLAGCTESTESTSSAATTETSTETGAVALTVASTDEALADNAADHDDAADHEWDEADEVVIALEGSTATADDDGVSVDGSTVTITAAGTYRLSGTLTDGQVVVDTADEDIVRVILDDADIASSTTSPFVVTDAAEVMVVLADGTQNRLADAAEYVYPDDATDEPNAALFSTADLTIAGTGALDVEGNAYDGITSKDGLVIASGSVTVTAVDDGIRGKDYLVVDDGTITVTAGGDALKSDNAEDPTMGYVSVAEGTLDLTSAGDGIDAATDVVLLGGAVEVEAGGGSEAAVSADVSTKGIKAGVAVVVAAGQVEVDSADDALHTNGYASVTGGELTLASGDDGVHADATLTVAGGTLTVTRSYEGLEGGQIVVSDGTVSVTSTDDGINVAGGTDSSGTAGPGGAAAGGMPTGDRPAGDMPAGDMPAQGGRSGGAGGGGAPMGTDTFTADAEHFLDISGGTLVVNADGDGLDSNGSIEISGGTTVVNGPTNSGNGAIDAETGVLVTGGTVLAAGSSGMAQTPASTSTQASLALSFDSGYAAGTVIQVSASDGTLVAAFEASKTFQSIVLTSPAVVAGESYSVTVGGSVGADSLGGFSTTGDATGATSLGSVTAS